MSIPTADQVRAHARLHPDPAPNPGAADSVCMWVWCEAPGVLGFTRLGVIRDQVVLSVGHPYKDVLEWVPLDTPQWTPWVQGCTWRPCTPYGQIIEIQPTQEITDAPTHER